jgi:YVTN family beta-propeller protein
VLAGAVMVFVLLSSPSALAASPVHAIPAIRVWPTVSVGSGPDDMAYDPGTHTLYTVNQGASVSVVNTAHCNAKSDTGCGQRVGTIALPPDSSPQSIDIDTATNTLYVADTVKNLISVINVATCTATVLSGCSQSATLVPDPSGPLYVAVNSVTDTVYITNPQLGGNDTVSVLDGASCNGQVTSGCGQALKTVHVGLSPSALAIDQVSDTVYVANEGIIENGDTVSVIDGATCNGTQSSGCGQVQTITVGEGPNWMVLDPTTHTAYTANLTEDTVSIINTATCNATVTSGCDQKTSSVHVGANPWALSIDLKLHSVYVANNFDDTVSVLDTATCNATVKSGCGAVPPTFQVGGAPQALLVDPTTGTLYAANDVDSSVSVVNAATCGHHHERLPNGGPDGCGE